MLTAAAAYRSSAAAATTRRFAVARPPAATDARQRIAALTLSRPTRIRNASTRAYIAPISHAFATDSLFPYEAEPTNQQQHRHASSQILSTSPAKPSASILRRIAQKLKRWARSILDALWVAARATEIGVILSPLLVLTPASVLTVRLLDTSKVSDMSWWYTLHSLQLLGPAFVKLAQWAATRRDLFPPHICNRLSRLHDNARIHSWKHTDETLAKAFGNYKEKGLQMDPNDIIGSGSAAQVYRAKLAGQTVAIKVLHPKISERVDRDLMLMRRVASLLDSVPIEMIRMLSLPRATDNFASVLSKQVDLRIEGKNLSRFHDNFTYQKKSLMKAFMSTNIPSSAVLFPQPVEGWVSRDVLVEEYVDNADPIAKYLHDDSPEGMKVRKELAGPLLRSYLKMVFLDNFTHCDLHAGNVLIKHALAESNKKGKDSHTIVFLDAGLAISLSPNDRRNLVDLFRAVILNEGEEAGRLMVERARYERCSQVEGGVEAFSKGVGQLVNEFHDNRKKGLTLGAVRIGSLLGRVLDLCRVHQVEVDPAMANIVISTLVLEGLGRSLASDLNLLDFALPFVLRAGKV